MFTSRTARLAATVAALVALGACSSGAKTATVTGETLAAPPPTTTASTTATDGATSTTAAGASTTTAVAAPTTTVVATSKHNPGKLGVVQTTGDGWTFRVQTVTFQTGSLGLLVDSAVATPAAGNQFVAVRLEAGYNGTAASGALSDVTFHATGASGATYDASKAKAADAFKSDATVAKGATAGGTVVFEVATADALVLTVDARVGTSDTFMAAHG